MPDNPIEESEQKLEKLVKSEPWYVWAGAAGAAGVMVYFIWKRKQATPAASTAQSTDPVNGYQVDSMAGLPYGSDTASGYNYQAGPVDNWPGGLQEVGVNGSNYPIIPYGDTPIYDANGNLIGFQGPNPNPTTSPSPAPTPAPPGKQPGPPGAPILTYTTTKAGASLETTPHDTNGGKNILSLPLGAILTFVSGPVPDPVKGSSKQYYLVSYNGKTGYVGSDAIVKTASGGGGIPDDAEGFHLAVNAGRNTADQWIFSNGMHHDFDSHASIGE